MVPTLTPGVELLGAYQGSGFRSPRYLARRGDGQVAQLPAMLYRLACLIDGHRDIGAIAAALGAEYGTEFHGSSGSSRGKVDDPSRDSSDAPSGAPSDAPSGAPPDAPSGAPPDAPADDSADDTVDAASDDERSVERVTFLLDRRLRPAGIVAPPALPDDEATADRRETSGGAGDAPTRRDHLLMLRLRKALVPERVVWHIAGVFAPLFHPIAVLVLMAAFVAIDTALVVSAGWSGLVSGGQVLVSTPTLTLAVLATVAVAGMFHESGHVAACRYGGAIPGPMGVGVYIVWPAFYSTVTDAYRLSRGGRLRTDLGGVYFNAIAMAALGAAYLVTGSPWLLAAVALLHLETAWQFLPSLRLDGYYILADLVGVPDLFARMRPILTGLVHPRRTPPAAVRELKPWVRRTVTVWVLLVVPFLAYWVVMFVLLAPALAPSAWAALQDLTAAGVGAVADLRPALAALAAVQIVLLVLPWIGGTVLAGTLVRRLVRPPLRAARRAVSARRARGTGGSAAART